MPIQDISAAKIGFSAQSAQEVACRDCDLFQLTFPVGVSCADLKMLDRIVKRRKTIQRGQYLYRAGDPFLFVYAVKSGSIKTYASIEGGGRQITGFHLPGELLGLDAIDTGMHQCNARALETTSVCEVPFSGLEELGEIAVSVQRQLLRIMSKQLLRDQSRLALVCNKNAEERLCAFLLNLSARFRQRGFSPTEFYLSMSRTDIGNYLGLVVETVSRLFRRFQEQGVLEVDRKHIRIPDLSRLRRLAGFQEPEASESGER